MMTRFVLFLGIAAVIVLLVLYLVYLAKTAPFMDDNGRILPDQSADEGRKSEEIKPQAPPAGSPEKP